MKVRTEHRAFRIYDQTRSKILIL